MARDAASRRQAEDDEDLPAHESIDEQRRKDAGGVTVNLDELDEGKDKDKDKGGGKDKERERGARRGGEEREVGADTGALDEVAEESDEEVRARRKLERQTRKDERQRRERALESQLESTRTELEEVKKGLRQGEVRDVRQRLETIEGEMSRLQSQYAEAKAAKEKAWKDSDAKVAVEADEIMLAARERFRSLGTERDQIYNEAQQQDRRPRVSPELQRHAKAFMSEHDWYDIKGGDKDSAKVLSIDRKMAADGWDPNTAGYWQELADRVREELPHRFEEEEEDKGGGDREQQRPRKRQTTGGSGREGGSGGGNTFYINAERVKALKEAGMWDDPAQRAKMIRKYKEQDEKSARERAERR